MDEFKPFANDAQVVTFTSAADEMSMENGTDEIVLSGTLTITKGDHDSHAAVLELRNQLDGILHELGDI